MERRDESVPAAGNCFDEGGFVGGIAEGFPKALYGGIQAVFEINKSVFLPQSGAKLLAADDFSGTLEEFDKDAVGLVLKLELHTVFAKLAGA
jgi:hypothetical protein